MTQSPTGPAAFGSGEPWIDSSAAPAAQALGKGAETPIPTRAEAPHAKGLDTPIGNGAEAPPPASAPGRVYRRLPGGRVVLVATLVIIAVALVEVLERDRIGQWTGVTLVTISALAAFVTRPGDRSLPAMMPPLAFLIAVLIAGQQLLSPSIDDPKQRQAVMIIETLGDNAAWVLAATGVAVLIALIGHLVTRRSRRREAEAGG